MFKERTFKLTLVQDCNGAVKLNTGFVGEEEGEENYDVIELVARLTANYATDSLRFARACIAIADLYDTTEEDESDYE